MRRVGWLDGSDSRASDAHPIILRVETAAIYGLSVHSYELLSPESAA